MRGRVVWKPRRATMEVVRVAARESIWFASISLLAYADGCGIARRALTLADVEIGRTWVG